MERFNFEIKSCPVCGFRPYTVKELPISDGPKYRCIVKHNSSCIINPRIHAASDKGMQEAIYCALNEWNKYIEKMEKEIKEDDNLQSGS